MFGSKLFSCKINEITPQNKINNIKNSIDPNIVKPDEKQEEITFKDIKKEDKKKAKKQELDKKEKDKNVKIPGLRLIESIKRDRKDLIIKPSTINIEGNGSRSEQIKEKREKLQKLKDLLKELKENS